MDGLQNELAARAVNGYLPTTVKKMQEILKSLGYRLDRRADCITNPRYLTGPRAGESYPAITTGVLEIDTGKSFAHYEARRDENFDALQKLRFNESLFAVVRGRILDI